MDRSLIPSASVLAAHGLTELEIDTPPAPNLPTPLSARAHFCPVVTYPSFVSIDPQGERVRLRWISRSNIENATLFRRSAQVIAFDCCQTSLAYTLSNSQSYHAQGSGSEIPGSDQIPFTTEEQLYPPRRAGMDKEVLAWWEDEHGLWLVTRQENLDDFVTITQFWDNLYDINGEEDRDMFIDDGTGNISKSIIVLSQMIYCFRSLHDKGLSLMGARPHDFAIKRRVPHHVVATHLDNGNVYPLPGFRISSVIDGTAVESSSLFLPPVVCNLKHFDQFLKETTSFLSPEVNKERVPLSSDVVYACGIVIFELLTGHPVTESWEGTESSGSHSISNGSEMSARPAQLTSRSLRGAALAKGGKNPLPRSVSSEQTNNTALERLESCLAKCLEADPGKRYISLDGLLYDLSQIIRSCKTDDWEHWVVGEANEMASFTFPPEPILFDNELETLNEAVLRSKAASSCQSINVWGVGGSGKSLLLKTWAQHLARSDHAHVLGSAKLDEQSHHLPSFSQIYDSLLRSTFADPHEDLDKWRERILSTTGPFSPALYSLLPQDTSRLIMSPQPLVKSDRSVSSGSFKRWCGALLQLFATRDRPLIITIDDAHWMPAEELDIWRHILGGRESLQHCVVVASYRTSINGPAAVDQQISASGHQMAIGNLPLEGVQSMISTCFRAPLNRISILSQLLFKETGGNPLYLLTLLQHLVRSKIVHFNFTLRTWEFDAFALQAHLTTAGMEAYFDWLQIALPSEVKECINALSLLPARTTDVDMLAQYLGQSKVAVEGLVSMAVATGIVRKTRNEMLKFSHDHQRTAAYRLIPSDRLPFLLLNVSNFLRGPVFGNLYSFESAKLALQARALNVAPAGSAHELVTLVLDAVAEIGHSAAFKVGREMLNSVAEIIQSSGGSELWLSQHHDLYLRYLDRHTDICGALKAFDDSFAIIQETLNYVQRSEDRLRLITLQVRLMIAANDMGGATKLFFDTMRDFGYDPLRPIAVSVWEPQTVADVKALEKRFLDIDAQADCIMEGVTLLICAISPTLLVTQDERMLAVFELGASVVSQMNTAVETSGPCLAMYTIVCPVTEVKMALDRWIRKMITPWSTSIWTARCLSILAIGLLHQQQPLDQVADQLARNFENCYSLGDMEMAAYNSSFELIGRIMHSGNDPLNIAVERHRVMLLYLPTPHLSLLKVPIQYLIGLARHSTEEPWAMRGFLTSADIESMEDLLMHKALYMTLKLRLAVLYDASRDCLRAIVEEGEKYVGAIRWVVGGAEWHFLAAFVALHCEKDKDEVSGHLSAIKIASNSPDYDFRSRVLDVMLLEEDFSFVASNEMIKDLDAAQQHVISGMLNYNIARRIISGTRNSKLASGYLCAASAAFEAGGARGVYDMLHKKFPDWCARPVGNGPWTSNNRLIAILSQNHQDL